jgi:hypothetical protein
MTAEIRSHIFDRGAWACRVLGSSGQFPKVRCGRATVPVFHAATRMTSDTTQIATRDTEIVARFAEAGLRWLRDANDRQDGDQNGRLHRDD